MTALVVTSIALGIVLVTAAIGIPLWLAARAPAPAAGYWEARAYLQAKAAAARGGLTVPAPRAPAAAETRPVSRQAVRR